MPSTRDFNAEAREQARQVEATMPALQRAYARGIRELLRRADANFVHFAGAPSRPLVAAGEADWPMPDLDELFTIDWGVEVLEAKTRAQRAAMTAAATGVWADDLEPAVRARISGEIIQMLGQRITEVTQHVRDHAGVMLRQGLDEGWSVRKTAKHLAASSPEFSRSRGMLIARTEMIGAANAGSLATARSLGAASHKVWHARMDSRTRPTHAEANGQSVRLHEPFQVDGVLMQYPGAEGAPAAEVCNCRCIILYDNPDQEGNVPPIIADAGDREAIIAAAFAEMPSRISVPGVLRFVTSSQERVFAPAAPADDEEPEGDEQPRGSKPDGDGDEPDEGDAPPARSRFEMLLIPLAHPTSDGRMIDPAEPGAVSARELPLSLMAQFETPDFGGHAGARVAGRIDTITEGDAEAGDFSGRAILATGVYDDAEGDQGTEDGRTAARMAREGMLRGVSADIAPSEMELRDANGDPIDPEDEVAMMEAMFGDGIMAVTRGEIMGATQVPFPAFAESSVTVVASLEHVPALLAARTAQAPEVPAPTPVAGELQTFELQGVRIPAVSLDQAAAYAALEEAGLATVNEVRSWLGLGHITGGDTLRAGGAPTDAPRLVAAAGKGLTRRVRVIRDDRGKALRYEPIAEEEAS